MANDDDCEPARSGRDVHHLVSDLGGVGGGQVAYRGVDRKIIGDAAQQI